MHSVKTRAKNLKTHLASQNISISYSQSLEAVAHTDGYQSWNHYAAQLEPISRSFHMDVVYATVGCGQSLVWKMDAFTRLRANPKGYVIMVLPFAYPATGFQLWDENVIPCPIAMGNRRACEDLVALLNSTTGKIIQITFPNETLLPGSSIPEATSKWMEYITTMLTHLGLKKQPLNTYLIDAHFYSQNMLRLAQLWQPLSENLCVFSQSQKWDSLENASFEVQGHVLESHPKMRYNEKIDFTVYNSRPEKKINACELDSIGGWCHVTRQTIRRYEIKFSGSHPSIDLFNEFDTWLTEEYKKRCAQV